MKRALLGVDGNCGFALLGEDLQVGESEFVEIAGSDPVGSKGWAEEASRAATSAYRKLQSRLADQTFSYRLDSSHPRFV